MDLLPLLFGNCFVSPWARGVQFLYICLVHVPTVEWPPRNVSKFPCFEINIFFTSRYVMGIYAYATHAKYKLRICRAAHLPVSIPSKSWISEGRAPLPFFGVLNGQPLESFSHISCDDLGCFLNTNHRWLMHLPEIIAQALSSILSLNLSSEDSNSLSKYCMGYSVEF